MSLLLLSKALQTGKMSLKCPFQFSNAEFGPHTVMLTVYAFLPACMWEKLTNQIFFGNRGDSTPMVRPLPATATAGFVIGYRPNE